jgi:hypothetical protein
VAAGLATSDGSGPRFPWCFQALPGKQGGMDPAGSGTHETLALDDGSVVCLLPELVIPCPCPPDGGLGGEVEGEGGEPRAPHR